MPKIMPSNATTIAKQVSYGAYGKSIGKIGQQKGVQETQATKQARIKYQRELAEYNKNVSDAKTYITKINAGQITNISQIPANLRPFINITQGQLDDIQRQIERDRRDRRKARRRQREYAAYVKDLERQRDNPYRVSYSVQEAEVITLPLRASKKVGSSGGGRRKPKVIRKVKMKSGYKGPGLVQVKSSTRSPRRKSTSRSSSRSRRRR